MQNTITLIGGGTGAGVFTKALLGLGSRLTTILSSFDDGGSTGILRRDYGGIAVGDLRQAILASLQLEDDQLAAMNHRFGFGRLRGMNTVNILLAGYLQSYRDTRTGILKIHELLRLKNKIFPISYKFAHLCAELAGGRHLKGQDVIASYLDFSREKGIRRVYLDRIVPLAQEAANKIIHASYLIFCPGHFYTSILPHLAVRGFARVWKKSKARKIWFANIMAHNGQDANYQMVDYLNWFQKYLGRKPFDEIVINRYVDQRTIRSLVEKFTPIAVTNNDKEIFRKLKIKIIQVDLVSENLRKQLSGDIVKRAPMIHDFKKVRAFFQRHFGFKYE